MAAAFYPAQDQMLDRIEADCAELDRLLHRRMQIGELETFQQSQNLHVFPPTMLGHAAFHQPAQRGELVRQIPALQRSGLIQRIDLLLDQRQIMDRVEDDVFPLPAPRMASNDLATAADDHLIDIAPDPDILMTVGGRHGIIIGLVAYERLGRDLGAGLIAGIEG